MRRRGRRPISVIVLDVMTPEMNGLEVCAALKKRAASRSIPTILLSARNDMETRQQATRLGVSEFVVKPASGRDLLAHIQTQLEVSRKARELEQALANIDKKPPKAKK